MRPFPSYKPLDPNAANANVAVEQQLDINPRDRALMAKSLRGSKTFTGTEVARGYRKLKHK